jgi:two-component system OmpR family response regulator
VLRRTLHTSTQVADGGVYRFSGWQLDTIARSLTAVDGKSIALTGADYDLLLLLLRAPGQVLSRSELMAHLSGREFDPFDRTIDVRISRLRQLLDDDARSSQIIKTVYGKGYTLGVPVEKE